MEISRAASPNSDKFTLSSGTLTYGGTLTVNNIGAALVGGELFDLFDASSFGGSFTTLNLPTVGTGTNWYTDALTTDGTLLLNRAPTIASNPTYARQNGVPLKIKLTDLQALWTELDSGQTLTLSVTSPTGQGATVTTNATHLMYEPVNNNNDTVNYTISDQRGGTANGLISITVSPSVSSNSIVQLQVGAPGANSNTITLAGIPNYTYSVQFSTNLTDWESFTTNNAGNNGLWTVIDDTATNATRFYRSLQQ
jgi:hypothetical protein